MSARVLAITAGVSVLLSCSTTGPSVERNLVGTWISCRYGWCESRPKPGEVTIKCVYKPDHTYVASSSDKPDIVTGTWKIEGDDLVQRVDRSSEEQRTSILLVTDSKLV